MKRITALSLLVFVVACGGGGGGGPTVVTPPAAPAASITATGAGTLVVHPSINLVFVIAMETPIRVTETAGGSADWSFARMQFFLNGQEIERTELGAAQIAAAGSGRVGARSNAVYNMVFRFNSSDFDDIVLTLGFGDVRDGRQFTVTVPFESFTDVDVDFTPLRFAHSPDPL